MENKWETVIKLCKSRGFMFPSSEIYDGFSGVYDYGPLGVELEKNIKAKWWKETVHRNKDIVGIDSAIFTNPKVWEASGHTSNFSDPCTTDKKTGIKYRVDHLLEKINIDCNGITDIEKIKKLFNENKKSIKIDGVDTKDLQDPEFVNLLVESNLNKTKFGKSYLRGETCQGIFINYKNISNSINKNISFGVAQIGKAFRNEISARQFVFRLREFQQMEMQYFDFPNKSKENFERFKKSSFEFLISLGISKENIRFKEHDNLVFYCKNALDIEYKYPVGWKELEGIHDRGDWDLSQHQKFSKTTMEFFDEMTKKNYTPNVIETSIGVERLVLAVLLESYTEEELPDKTTRVVLKLKPEIAPIYVAVLPLFKKENLKQKADSVFNILSSDYVCFYDETQSIGKRYRRADEVGTPFCITIDYQTLEDNTVTIRNRDSMKQDRVKISDLKKSLSPELLD